jgi:hypothetical protein
MAFVIAPVSAPFFIIGAGVALSLLYVRKFITRLHGRAAEKANLMRMLKT